MILYIRIIVGSMRSAFASRNAKWRSSALFYSIANVLHLQIEAQPVSKMWFLFMTGFGA